MPVRRKPVVLIVRDGWGRNPHREHDRFNAVKLARTPHCDALLQTYPWTLIHTSGEAVGLPDGTMGNSEVGHQNLGAGRIVDQESVRITQAIHNGTFGKNEALVEAIRRAEGTGRPVHLVGIASDAGVHGLLSHLYGCLALCKAHGREAALHLLTDGRDTGPFTGKGFVRQIEQTCRAIGVGRIVSICGRYYAMDRDNRWERVAKAYELLTGRNDALPAFANADDAVQDYYDNPTNNSQRGDEFITPRYVGNGNTSRVEDGDSVIFYNYRGDRPRQIIRAFVLPNEQWSQVKPSPDTGERGFDRGRRLNVHLVTMTAYEQGLPVHVAFLKPPKMTDIAGQYLSNRKLTQFRCAETEKFPHVTFFFNDYREEPFPGESHQMAQSPEGPTYDLKPQMSAHEVTDIVLERINANDCENFILVNFANGDMVGHTGKLDAAVTAIETVDTCVGRIAEATLA
ncbi:MAG: 2,3-bisphosphoglycerate-independent phosphoglycerate mutase, partial [Phycisphaeraceae bacterium]